MFRQLKQKNMLIKFMFIMLFASSASVMAKTPVVSLPDFSVLAEQNSPVVVNISTIKKVSPTPTANQQFRGVPDEMLRHFFGIPKDFFPRGQQPRTQPRKVSSFGSGFIISADGYIVTNNHVVDNAKEIIVKLNDRTEHIATVIGTDPRTDIALLKIDANNLAVAKIGVSKNLKVGQWVIAIGDPFGLDNTVTHGIISALGRSLPGDPYVPFIQTDVSINPGNSGGPLINMSGEVIGVNSQIYSKGGGSMGLSFSIPIDIAMNVVHQLKDTGTVQRGFLGVSIQEVSADLAKSFGLERPKGALVSEVIKGKVAEKHGFLSGDIIIKFDGHYINKSADLPPIVGMTKVDKKVTVKLLREGKVKYISLRLGELNTKDIASLNNDGQTVLGLLLQPVEDNKLQKLNLPFGLSVINVETDGISYAAGVRKGDILVSINFHPVKSVESLKELVESLPKDRSFPIRVVRGNRSIFFPLSLQ